MPLIIYVDVLIVLNFIVNYLLLAVSTRLSGGKASRLRLALAALIGAFFSLTIFLPPLPQQADTGISGDMLNGCLCCWPPAFCLQASCCLSRCLAAGKMPFFITVSAIFQFPE